MKTFFAILFLILFSAGLYTTTLRGIYGNNEEKILAKGYDYEASPFETSHERGPYAHVLALAQTGQYALTEAGGKFAHPDVGYHKGKFFSFFAPGIAYMILPFYKLGYPYNLSQVFSYAFISLVSIAALVFLFLIARQILKLPLWASLLAPLLFSFSSFAWSYSGTIYQHHVSVFLIFSAFYFAWRFKENSKASPLWALLVGINYGIAFMLDYPNAILFLPVGVYLFILSLKFVKEEARYKIEFRPSFIIAILGFAAITGLHFWHNTHYFGSPFRLSGGLIGIRELEARGLVGKTDSEVQAALHSEIKSKENVVGFFTEENLPRSFGILIGSTDRGIALYSPIMLLGVFGILFYFVKKKWNIEISILVALLGVNLFLYSSWGDPWGGWAFGPRYLIPATTVLSFFVASFLSQGKWLWVKRIIALPLIAYSSAVALLGVLTTNAVPPKVEALFLGGKWNFLYNWDLFKAGKSGSFAFNEYFHKYITLEQYGYSIYACVFVVFILILFVFPIFEKTNVGKVTNSESAQ